MRAPYAYYACHALRYYFSHPPNGIFFSQAEQQNWQACHDAILPCDDGTKALLKEIFADRQDSMKDIVAETAKNHAKNPNDLWTLIAQVEKRFARYRGLI